MKRAMMLSMLALLLGSLAHDAIGNEGCCGAGCPNCGCNKMRKVCKLVPDVKKVTTFCYSLKCDDFCLHGRSKCVGTQEVCTCRGTKCEHIMQPTCCEVMTRRQLVKTPIVKEKHGWKCIVETVCCGCGGCCTTREATAAESDRAIDRASNLASLNNLPPGELVVPFDDAVTPVSANEPIQARKPERLIDRLLGTK